MHHVGKTSASRSVGASGYPRRVIHRHILAPRLQLAKGAPDHRFAAWPKPPDGGRACGPRAHRRAVLPCCLDRDGRRSGAVFGARSGTQSAGGDDLKALAATDAVDVKVGVEREDPAVTMLLGECDKGGIGEVHGPVGVLIHQPGAAFERGC